MISYSKLLQNFDLSKQHKLVEIEKKEEKIKVKYHLFHAYLLLDMVTGLKNFYLKLLLSVHDYGVRFVCKLYLVTIS